MPDPVRAQVFALPPGADFASAFAEGLLARFGSHAPEELARITIIVNAAPMQRVIRAALAATGARLLPRISVVTDIGSDPLAPLPTAIPPLRRLLALSALLTRYLYRVPDVAPPSAAFDLAQSLAALLDECHDEGVPLSRLEAPELVEGHAAHWERSLAFVRIAFGYLAEAGEPDEAARFRLAAEQLVSRWAAAPPDDPVIVAGSTGSRGTTAFLMQAVARLPRGMIVLPGFDFETSPATWASLGEASGRAEDHPQYRFWRLLGSLGLRHADVRRWHDSPPPSAARNRLVSLALCPAPVTDRWRDEGPSLGDLAAATAKMAILEAPSPREEAAAIAVALRHAAGEGRRAALITPDRTLARRVAAALGRWGIIPDDSAGVPLPQTPPGRLMRHVASTFGAPLTAEALVVLLKHPLAATGASANGSGRGEHLLLTRELELTLRRKGPAFPDPDWIAGWCADQKSTGAGDWGVWLGDILRNRPETDEATVAGWTASLLWMAERIAAGPGGSAAESGLWQKEAGIKARSVAEALSREAPNGGMISALGFRRLLDLLLAAENVPQGPGTDPRISIRGTLEARGQTFDLVILGGLNEGVWPPRAGIDPWMSRQMRLKAGLLLPERRIGLSAHDFQQAIGAPEVILTRSLRDDEAETIPSRWWARIVQLLDGLPQSGGTQALGELRARGNRWLGQAFAVERAETTPAAPRPAPRPPVEVRPKRLSVTEIRKLILDPYAIYARRILRLEPLELLRAQPDARLRGQVLHKVMEAFLKERVAGETPSAARLRFLAAADRVLAEEVAWHTARTMWRARLERIASVFLSSEQRRSIAGEPVILESRGEVAVGETGFVLTARPDRIDRLQDGRVHIFDYKTGEPPSLKAQARYDMQLLLEAGMAERGAFDRIGQASVAGATYIRLGGDGKEMDADTTPESLAAAWANLERLVRMYANASQPYIARRITLSGDVARAGQGEYDQLSRVGEWGISDGAVPEDVP